MRLNRNGMRQPQVRNCAPENSTHREHRRVGEEQAARDAELGPGGDEASGFARASPFHGHENRPAPLSADAHTLDEAQNREDNSAPDPDAVVSRHERHGEGRDAHHHERGDQRGLAPDPVSVMAEDRSTDGARHEADGINGESLERADERIGFREEKLGEDEACDHAIEEEIIPFDRGADRARDHGSPELHTMLCLRQD